MTRIDIDLTLFTERMAAHAVLRQVLAEQGYTANNLDAFHDVLTDLNDTLIVVHGARGCEGYAMRALRVIIDSAMENPGITLKFE